MFTITSRDSDETSKPITFSAIGTLSLNFSKEWIGVDLMVSAKDVPLADDFTPNISISSEWLTLKLGALSKNDLNLVREIVIEESDGVVQFKGADAKTFGSDESSVFYYYVDQALGVDNSQSKITPLGLNRFRFQHESVVDFYTLKIDIDVPFLEVTAAAYHHEPNAPELIEELKEFFIKNFAAEKFAAPVVSDTGTCLLLKYKVLGSS